MEAVVDAEGRPAPRLIDADLPAGRAAELYSDLRQQTIRILRCDLIHGDLSPYNVLLAWNGPTVIDLPQVVGAAHNSQAAFFFRRDLEALRRFFASLDPTLDSRASDADEIWQAYVRRELGPDFTPVGRAEPTSRGPRRAAGSGQPSGGPRGGGGTGHFGGPPPRRGGGPGTHQLSQGPASRSTAPPAGQARSGVGPVVSYVGRPPERPSTGAAGQPAKHRRRRRSRRRGGPPPQR